MGFRVQGFWGLGFRGLGFRVKGFGVSGSAFPHVNFHSQLQRRISGAKHGEAQIEGRFRSSKL